MRNIRKILEQSCRFVLNLTAFPLSSYFRRDQSLWVFGHQGGGFEGNTKYLYLWLWRNRPDIRAVWMTSRSDVYKNLKEIGYNVVLKWSLKGIIVALRARVYIFCHSANDVNLSLCKGAYLVNLWHGVGLKIVGPKNKTSKAARYSNYAENFLVRAALLDYLITPNLIVSTSDSTAARFSALFDLPITSCPVLGTPRLDSIFDHVLRNDAIAVGDYTSIREARSFYREFYIYMPTWRDSGRDFIPEALPDIELLSTVLERRNAVLYIKLHPHTRITGSFTGENIRLWPTGLDFYPILDEVDVLITDYSSVMFDFLALKDRGLVLYIYDYDDYIERERSLYYDYDSNTEGLKVRTFKELCDSIASGKCIESLPTSRVRHLRDKFWGGNLKLASQEVTDEILHRISE